MSLDIGINFRGTSGHATDGTNETYCIGDQYPTTRGGVTFGWDMTVNILDRTSSDRRFAGINYNVSSTTPTFRLDLPATGSTDVHFAAGDIASSQWAAWLLKDNTTQFASTTSFTSAADKFKDASNVELSSAAWPGSETKVTRTFGSTVLNILCNQSAATDVVAHVRVVQAGAASTTYPQLERGIRGMGRGMLIGSN